MGMSRDFWRGTGRSGEGEEKSYTENTEEGTESTERFTAELLARAKLGRSDRGERIRG